MISVIIPAYNSAAYIGSTIESVLNQSFEDFEILVVDDGSKDCTRKIVEEFQKQDSRIKYFYKENGGVSSARNLGIREALGDYVSFLDSDDLWKSYFLAKMYQKLTETQKKICYCGYIEQCGNSKITYPDRFDVEDILVEKLCSETFRISTDCWLIDRFLLLSEEINFTEGCHYIEDLEFFVKLLYKSGKEQITCVPEYLSYYILRPESLTSQQELVLPLPVMTQILDVQKRILFWLEAEAGKHKNKYIKYAQLALKRKYICFLWNLLLLGKYPDFKTLLLAFRRDRPHHFPSVPLVSIKYKIWKLAISCVPARYLCMIFLRPYKRIKRKRKIAKLSGNPDLSKKKFSDSVI